MKIEQITPTDLLIYFSSRSMLADADIIKAKLLKGEMEIFKLGGCAHITCFNELENGEKNLAVFCTEGNGYIKSCLELVKIAKSFNCSAVTFATHRKGIVRWALNNGAVIVSHETNKTFLRMGC